MGTLEPEGVPKPQENARVLEPPLTEITLFLFPPPFLFHRKEIFPWERGKHIKLGELPSILAWGSSARGDPSKYI